MTSASVSYDVIHSGFQLTDAQLVLMTDPAVAFLPDDKDYAPYHRGKDLDIYLKAENGSDFLGLVWPGKSLSLVCSFDTTSMHLLV